MHKVEQNCTKKKKRKKNPQSVPSSNAIQFHQVFHHAGVVWLFSHQM
jgi:hypothetical protein